MSSVFLTNVDDYLAPSQACVNPLFSGDNNSTKKREEPPKNSVVKRRVVRRKASGTTGSTAPPAIPSAPKQQQEFSLADCLACSGCVTTAETVLIEQHSLTTLTQKCRDAVEEGRPICVTISRASLADLMRYLQIDSQYQTWTRRLASFLHRSCHASIVLDGNVPLKLSLMEAAHEFCHTYRQEHGNDSTSDAMDIDDDDDIPAGTPSIALSSTETRYMLPNGESRLVTHPPGRQQRQRQGCSNPALPLLTSSCPALVCLVEKSVAGAVQHLATTKSPMSIAATLLKRTSSRKSLHVSIMPCHDKKLEASRKDFVSKDEIPDTDLVITTREWLDLLLQHVVLKTKEAVDNDEPLAIRKYLEALPLCPVEPSIVTNDKQEYPVVLVSQIMASTNTITKDNDSFYPLGSGGYADFVFRFASQKLFGVAVHEVPWKPVVSQRRMQSARVSSSHKKKDFYQAVLYQHADGTFDCNEPRPGSKAVLNFCTAYGLQNIQRVLQPLKLKESVSSFHYVEAMACPSGCLNGGGQVRLQQEQRETPTETRRRVHDTRRVMMSQCDDLESGDSIYPNGTRPFGNEAQRLLHTSFHIVPQLQATDENISNGMVVDTRW